MNISLLPRLRKLSPLRRLVLRNILFLQLLLIFLVLGFFVGRAYASPASESSSPAFSSVPAPIRPEIKLKPPQVNVEPVATIPPTTAPPVSVAPPATVPPAPVPSFGSETIQGMIVESAVRHGLDPNRMLRIADCESGFSPSAVNYNYSVSGTHPSGLFQHVAVYWPSRAVKYGFPGASVFDVKAQIEVTMGMFRDGGAGAWACT